MYRIPLHFNFHFLLFFFFKFVRPSFGAINCLHLKLREKNKTTQCTQQDNRRLGTKMIRDGAHSYCMRYICVIDLPLYPVDSRWYLTVLSLSLFVVILCCFFFFVCWNRRSCCAFLTMNFFFSLSLTYIFIWSNQSWDSLNENQTKKMKINEDKGQDEISDIIIDRWESRFIFFFLFDFISWIVFFFSGCWFC